MLVYRGRRGALNWTINANVSEFVKNIFTFK